MFSESSLKMELFLERDTPVEGLVGLGVGYQNQNTGRMLTILDVLTVELGPHD